MRGPYRSRRFRPWRRRHWRPMPPPMMPRRRWYPYGRGGGCCGCLPGCVLPMAIAGLILGAILLPGNTNEC